MGLARSTYYDRPQRAADDTAIVEALFALCDEFATYGYRRAGAALRQQGTHRRGTARAMAKTANNGTGGSSPGRPPGASTAVGRNGSTHFSTKA
jgi:hypothetical protein